MKVRNGFISNSSSSCFILDLKNPGTQKLVIDFSKLELADGLGRSTAIAVGDLAVDFAKRWIKDLGDYEYSGIGQWILSYAEILGKDNVVFLRESDENMEGSFPYEIPKELIISEMEYH